MANSLKDICVYDAKLKGNEFVGIKIEDGLPKVYFPLGYSKTCDEKEERKDILNLISVLSSYGKKADSLNTKTDSESSYFPIHAYISVFVYFLNYGYYVETESVHKRGYSGKINWNRTIKTIRPQVSDNSAVYLDFIIKKNSLNENALITQIHKFCVYESYKQIGQIFNFPRPVKPAVAFHKEMFISALRAKIANTFNERNLQLFHNMLDILLSMAENDKPRKLFYGTEDFEYVWEGLIEQVFGISNKQKYYPKCLWTIGIDKAQNADWQESEKTSLRPDTIMLMGEKVFVLDSKYYKYGATKNFHHLPGTGSIVKQIAYAEHIETQENMNGNNIYNAFILPYDASSEKWLAEQKQGDFKIAKFGCATGTWKKATKAYEKIHGILLDVRSIMHRHPENSDSDIAQLAEKILNA